MKKKFLKMLTTSWWKESSTWNYCFVLTVQCNIKLKLLWIFTYQYSYYLIAIKPSHGNQICDADYGSYERTGFGYTIHKYKFKTK